jgi:hypothetical protein
LIGLSDSVSMNELSLILEIIDQCDIKHIMKLPIKTITSVSNVVYTGMYSITAHPN